MPYTAEDAMKHMDKADTLNKQKQWASVANSVMNKCMMDGGNEKDCSAKGIMQANGVITKLSEDSKDSFYYLTDISNIELVEKEGEKSTTWIEIFREGKWNHPKHGVIEGNKKLFDDLINNWKSNVIGRDISFDKTHDPSDGATGWVKDLKVEGDRLKAFVELTPWGIDLIKNKGFKYFSPEYTSKYTHKETGVVYNNVLLGGGITNRPFLTDLNPIVMSEDMEKDFKLSLYNMPQPVVAYESHMDMYSIIDNFTGLIKQLTLGGYISIEELKQLTVIYLTRIDFSNSDQKMSEDLKFEISQYLEEYFEDKQLGNSVADLKNI